MDELKIGKLYCLTFCGNFCQFDNFVYACCDPLSDVDDLGISIEYGSIVVYLGELKVKKFWSFAMVEHEYTYYKILFNDKVLYILYDGACSFVEIN